MAALKRSTRREFLRNLALTGGGFAALSLLAGCGGGGTSAPTPATAGGTSPAPATGSGATPAAPGQTKVAALRLLMPSSYPLGQIAELKELNAEAIKAIGASTPTLFQNLQAWRKDNPTTKLEIEEVKWDTISQKFVTVMQGGDAPDLTMINDLNIRELALGGNFLPMNRYAGNWDDYNQALLKGVATVKDEIIAMPFTTDCRCMYYWKEDWVAAGVTEPPTTWAGLYEVAAKLNKPNKIGFLFPAGPSVHTPTQSLFSSVWMQGVELQNANGRIQFDTPAMRKVFEHYNRLMNDLKVAPRSLLTATDPERSKLQATKGAAMFHDGSWRWDALPLENAEANDKTLGYFRTPKPSADAKDSTLTGFWAFELPKTSDKARQDAAWDLANYFTGTNGQTTAVSNQNVLPTRSSVLTRTDVTGQKSAFWQFAAKYAVEAGHGMPSADQGAFSFDLFQVALQKYLSGEASLENALAEAQRKYDEKVGQA